MHKSTVQPGITRLFSMLVALLAAFAIAVPAYATSTPASGAVASAATASSTAAIEAKTGNAGDTLNMYKVVNVTFANNQLTYAFTPTFQATIPDILPDERDYTRALSLSRLAYDMESLTSPILAAGLLTVINFHWLFSGTAIGFLCSALLVVTTVLPRAAKSEPRSGGIYAKTTRGTRIYLKTPRLRGLLALTLASAAASSMVIVNTVVIVRGNLGLTQRDVAFTLAAFGAGSILAALTLPRILDRVADRTIMIGAAAAMTIGLALLAVLTASFGAAPGYWRMVLIGWFILGIAYSMSVTPSGRLLRRSANADDRPALFAAQFALSHCAWLICYPLVGLLGASIGQTAAFAAMAVIAAVGTLAASWLWPSADPDTVNHDHADLVPDHPHLRGDHGTVREHAFVIDDLHQRWPRP